MRKQPNLLILSILNTYDLGEGYTVVVVAMQFHSLADRIIST